MQDTRAPITHDKPGSSTALIHGGSLPRKNQYITPFSNFSWSEGGIELAIPVSAVEYFTDERLVRCALYSLHVYEVSSYVKLIDLSKFRCCIANFRSCAHNLMIEEGRYVCLIPEQR